MTTIYQIGDGGYFTGQQQDVADGDVAPKGWTRAPLPALAAGDYAIWQAGRWAVTQVPPSAPAPVVPASVSPRQIRQALNRVPHGAGTLRQAVEAAVAAGDQDLRDWWEFATEFERSNEHVAEMGLTLGKTDVELDDLWRLAVTL